MPASRISPHPRGGPTVVRMDTDDTIKTTEPRTVDPIQLAFAREAERLRNRRGISKRKLASLARVDPTQMTHFLNGKKGLSAEALSRVAGALGAALILSGDEDVARDRGTIDAQGWVNMEGPLTFPTYFEVVERGFAELMPGDRVLVVAPQGHLIGKLVMVQTNGGRPRLGRCVERHGIPCLQWADGDLTIYEPERHEIVALATERVPMAVAL